jgi:hypothetical protein
MSSANTLPGSQELEHPTNTPQNDSDDEPSRLLRTRDVASSSAPTKTAKLTLAQRMDAMEHRVIEAAELQEQRAQQLELALQHITSLLAAHSPTYSPPIPSRLTGTTQPIPRDPQVSDIPLPSVENVQDAPRQTQFGPKPRSQQLRTEMSGARQSLDPLVRDTTDSYQTPFSQSHFRKSQLTEKIIALDNGIEPTFIQWRISIRDRLEVNEDHYPTERARKALVWGATIGQAKEYLEPRYNSDTHVYTTAEEMIDILATYFLTGSETEEKRREFHALKQHENEPFPSFKASFISLAIQGKVAESEWFFYLWEKITERLRYSAGPVKILWNNEFPKAVQHLTSICRERRTNPLRIGTKTNAIRTGKKTSSNSTSTGVPQQSTRPYVPSSTRPHIPLSATQPHRLCTPTPGGRPAFARARTSTPAADHHSTSKGELTCFGCGKPGHYKSECPEGPLVKEIAGTSQEDNKDLEEEQEDLESEGIQEENDEA